jgi:hypothetical protein
MQVPSCAGNFCFPAEVMWDDAQDGGVIVAIDKLSCADAGVTSLQLRLGRMLLDTCDVPSPLAPQGASQLEMTNPCRCVTAPSRRS